MLRAIRHAPRNGTGAARPPLVIAHGLFGSARNWGSVARLLADGREVVAVDMRNHGESPWHASHGYADMAADLAETAREEARRAGAVDLLGHSMGGKAAMAMALARPGLARRIVVADIAPVAYGHDRSDLVAAMRSVDLARVERRSDAEAQLEGLVEDAATRAFLLQSLDVGARRWRLNLDALERCMDEIVGWPATDAAAALPALFLAGGESGYVTGEGRAEAKRLFPAARFARIPGAGHWLHAEKPAEFAAAARAFLDA